MTEEEAQAWLTSKLGVSRETMSLLQDFEHYVKAEAQQQNLVSAATMDNMWARHIVDSAQLLVLLDGKVPMSARWIDLGSGAGFPGLVVALLSGHQVTLVESRKKRADYLKRALERFNLEGRVSVAATALEKLDSAYFDVVSARAFAPLPRLLEKAARFSTDNTLWLLPKGQNAVRELAETRKMPDWRNKLAFDVRPSVTSGEAGILWGRLRK